MKAVRVLVVTSLGVYGVRAAQATVITQWAFPATVAAPDNSPAPTTGVGTAISLGMDNNYAYAGGELGPSVTNDDITQPGSKKQLQDFTWRIRGNGNAAGPGGNGWNNSAPNYTQGAEFEVSTAGASNITLSFDWYCTTQGVANMQVQYTLDDTQANPTWVNLGSDLIATGNNFFGRLPRAAVRPTFSICRALPALRTIPISRWRWFPFNRSPPMPTSRRRPRGTTPRPRAALTTTVRATGASATSPSRAWCPNLPAFRCSVWRVWLFLAAVEPN